MTTYDPLAAYELTCPDCRHCAEIERYQCGGADDGNIICPKCWSEFPTPGLVPVEIETEADGRLKQRTFLEVQ